MCVSRALGREHTHDVLLSVLRKFFGGFDWMLTSGEYAKHRVETQGAKLSQDENAMSNASPLAQTFDSKMAAFAYSNFCQLIGQETMRRSLNNSSLVEQLFYDEHESVGEFAPPRCVSFR